MPLRQGEAARLGEQVALSALGSESSPGPTGLLVAGLLGATLLLGGGGSPAPLPELALEWLAVLVGSIWLLLPTTREHWRMVPRSAWLVGLLIVLVPLLQLVPLPPQLWHALPGRGIEMDALTLIGREDSWRAWSMAPDRTLAALLSLLPPVVVLLMAATLGPGERLRLIWLVAAVGLASIVLGVLQLSSEPDSSVQLYGITSQTLRGFQANHNSTADILLAAMLALLVAIRAAVESRKLPNRAAVVLGLALPIIALFGFAVVLTASRMGILLLPVAIAAALLLLRRWLSLSGRTALAAGLGVATVAMLAGFALVRANPVLAGISERFDFAGELRVELWRDGLFVARKHYPVGVGMGDFVPALIADERLEVVRPAMPNRAHNEYVELAVEAGLAGLAAWAAVIVLVARGALRARRAGGPTDRAETLFAATVLGVLVLHSLVDYPFRSMALASLGAFCAALLLAAGDPLADGPRGKDHT